MTNAPVIDRDLGDARLVRNIEPWLKPYNDSGVLGPADIHAARSMTRLVDDERQETFLAVALAVRAPQHGHVCVELDQVAETVAGVDDAPVAAEDLVWPDLDTWLAVLRDSPLVAVRPEGTPEGRDPDADRPLCLVGTRLYLDRYWRYERRVAEVLAAMSGRVDPTVDPRRVKEILDRLLPAGDDRPDLQRLAVAAGALRDLTVIAGGPGTGKTHTVARLLALLHELAGDSHPRIAVAAPTGKAADRLTDALRDAAAKVDTTPQVRSRLRELEASTLHRLLGWKPGTHTRFAHDRDHKLPYDVVVVDETSMVDLPMMAKLVVALKKGTKLVLVGDPDQLASVEAGAVLADIVGPSADDLRLSPAARDLLTAATGEPIDDVEPAREDGIDDAVLVLGTVRRFGADSGIAALAAAIHAGDGDAAVGALRSGADDVTWVEHDGQAGDDPALAPVRSRLASVFTDVLAAAEGGDAGAALDHLDRVRVLCAHRRGLVGVSGWVPAVERWLATDLERFEPTTRWYVGKPVMVTRNEPRLRLFNGDVGVVVRAGDGVQVVFRGATAERRFAPSRLEDIDTVHAMTIHKSQGSQFAHVVVVLPDESSPILTRELLYTAVTRAKEGVTLVATEDALRAAISRRVARASGLRRTLWGQA